MLHTEICNNRPDPGKPVLGPPQPSLALRKPVSLLFVRIPVTYSRGAPWARSCQRDSDNPQHSLSRSGGADASARVLTTRLPIFWGKGGKRVDGEPPCTLPCTSPRLPITPGYTPTGQQDLGGPGPAHCTFHMEHQPSPCVPRVSAELGSLLFSFLEHLTSDVSCLTPSFHSRLLKCHLLRGLPWLPCLTWYPPSPPPSLLRSYPLILL